MLEPEDNSLEGLADRLIAGVPEFQDQIDWLPERNELRSFGSSIDITLAPYGAGYLFSLESAPVCVLDLDVTRLDLFPRLVALFKHLLGGNGYDGLEPLLLALPRKSAWLHLPVSYNRDFCDDSSFPGDNDTDYEHLYRDDVEVELGFERPPRA